jgi:hypothetical protein
MSSSRPRSACSGEARRVLWQVQIDGIEFRDPNAAGPRQSVQHLHCPRVAPEIGGQRNRIFRLHQLIGDGIDAHPINAAGMNGAIAGGIISRHRGLVPLLGQCFAR